MPNDNGRDGYTVEQSSRTEHWVAWGLAGLVLFAPLPFASNRPWSWSLLSLWVGALLLLWTVQAVRHPENIRIPFRAHWPVTVPFLGFILWGFFQATGGTPESWHHPYWAEYQSRLGKDLNSAVSLNPTDTVTSTMRLMAYGGAFWLALQLGRDRHRAIRLYLALIVAGFLYAAYGVLIQLSGSDTILWYEKWAYPGVLTSTFINRNHFATYAGMIAILAMAMTVRDVRNAGGLDSLSFAAILNALERSRIRTFFVFMAGIIAAVALILTQSRGGFLALTSGVLMLTAVLLMRKRRGVKAWLATVGAVSVAVAVLLQVAGAGLGERFQAADTEGLAGPDLRREAIGQTLDAVRSAPWMGTGYGTFDEVYHRTRPITEWINSPDADHAHNTYLEILLEGGPVGLALILSAFGWALFVCVRGALHRERSYTYSAAAAAVTVLIGVHALVDFSVQIPAVALSFAVVLGVGVAQSWHANGVGPRGAPRQR